MIVSNTLNSKRTARAGTAVRRDERTQFCSLSTRPRFHTASYQSSDIQIVETTTVEPAGAASRMQKNVQTVTTGLVWRFNFGGL
jgi:hypothetical protein